MSNVIEKQAHISFESFEIVNRQLFYLNLKLIIKNNTFVIYAVFNLIDPLVLY